MLSLKNEYEVRDANGNLLISDPDDVRTWVGEVVIVKGKPFEVIGVSDGKLILFYGG